MRGPAAEIIPTQIYVPPIPVSRDIMNDPVSGWA